MKIVLDFSIGCTKCGNSLEFYSEVKPDVKEILITPCPVCITRASDTINKALVEALENITSHFKAVMAGPLITALKLAKGE